MILGGRLSPCPAEPFGLVGVAGHAAPTGALPVSDIGDELDRLAGDRRHGLVIAIVAQHGQPLALRGGGNEQVYRASRPVRPGPGQQLLNFISALVYRLGHRHPAEQVVHQPLLLQPVGQRTRRIQELQLDDRAGRDDASGKLIRPRLPQLTLQDPEQPRCVDQVQGRAHLRYAALSPRNSSKSPRSAISPSRASARSRTSRWPTSRRAAFTVSFLVVVPRTSAAIARASWSISIGVFAMAMNPSFFSRLTSWYHGCPV